MVTEYNKVKYCLSTCLPQLSAFLYGIPKSMFFICHKNN